MIVDGSVVMVENTIRRMESERDRSRTVLQIVRDASAEVVRPITFGVAIIIAVYLPIFTLQGLEGRMFRPMAITVCSALAGSLLLALFAVPALCSFLLKNIGRNHDQHEAKSSWFDHVQNGYLRSLDLFMRFKIPVIIGALVLVCTAGVSLKYIGSEFMPKLDEGSLVVTTRKLPGSLFESRSSWGTRSKVSFAASQKSGSGD